MKVFRRISMWLLTLIMLFSCVTPVSALESQHTRWPVFSELAEDRYIAGGGYVHFNGWSSGAYFGTVNNAYVQLTLPEGTTNLNLSPAYHHCYGAQRYAPDEPDSEGDDGGRCDIAGSESAYDLCGRR